MSSADVTIKPSADGQVFTLENAAGSALFNCVSSSTISNSNCGVGSGANITGYSDNFATLTFNLDASRGLAAFQGVGITPASDASGVLQVNNHAGTPIISVTTNATAANSALIDAGGLSVAGTVSGTGFSNLLASPPAIGATSANSIKGTTLTATVGVITAASTVSGLPASPTQGERAFVTDAASCAFNTAVAGGGSTKCPVVFNGSAWVAG